MYYTFIFVIFLLCIVISFIITICSSFNYIRPLVTSTAPHICHSFLIVCTLSANHFTIMCACYQHVCICFLLYQLDFVFLSSQGQRDGEVEEEKREKPKATFEGEKLKELTEGEADVISDVINPNGLPVQNGLDVDVKEFG